MNFKFYTALDKNDLSIITVMASSTENAKKQISEQLNRPGRTMYIEKWVSTARRLAKTDCDEVRETPRWKRGDSTFSSQSILNVLDSGGVFYVDDD